MDFGANGLIACDQEEVSVRPANLRELSRLAKVACLVCRVFQAASVILAVPSPVS